MAQVMLDDIVGRDDLPTLAGIRASGGSNAVMPLVSSHIVSLYKFANIEIVGGQEIETAMFIISNYWYLNVAELAKFFSELKAGVYGQFIWGNRINNQQILAFLSGFVRHDRFNAITRNEQRKMQEKREKGFSNLNDFAGSMISGRNDFLKIKEAAKTDMKSFCSIYPHLPEKYPVETWWNAWKGDEAALNFVFGEKVQSIEKATDYISLYLCEYNSKIQSR